MTDKETIDAAISEEMQEFGNSIEGLLEKYQLVSKIGEGTFSSVYKAIDLQHHLYDNSSWDKDLHSDDDSDTLDKDCINSTSSCTSVTGTDKLPIRYVALKRIYVTSSPLRIFNEIAILNDLNGSNAVISLITAFRQEDQVVAVQPYFAHDEFREFYSKLTMTEIKCYFRWMFTALRHIHTRHIIHRDIKPSNFLYNVAKRRGVLVDFGLAQRDRSGSRTIPRSGPQNVSPTISRRRYPTGFGEMIQEMPGYLKNDIRPYLRVNRAGTRGFRAPEVLFKSNNQTVSIDIWSAGVILLSFLSGRFPFFYSYDDGEALMEIACLFGQKEMRECAALHKRTFRTNIPSIRENRITFQKLCESLQPEAYAARDENAVAQAHDLLRRCLDLNPKTRITAKEALEHPFLAEE